MIVPRRVLGRGQRAPSDTVNIAVVGFGSMGSQNAQVLAQSDHIGVVCDVDLAYSERCVEKLLTDAQGQARPEGVKLKEQFSKAKRYTDFREMLAKEKGVDGVRGGHRRSCTRRGRQGGDAGRQACLCAEAAHRDRA